MMGSVSGGMRLIRCSQLNSGKATGPASLLDKSLYSRARTGVAVGAETIIDRASPVAGFRILVVDDDWDAAQTLGMMFDATGNKARIAHDGLEAISAAAEFQADLILMDIAMPGLDGFEAARRIRAKPWGKGVTLAALTGWIRDDVREWAEEAGFDHYFVKPVEFAMLLELLASTRRPPASM
jgi:CheY-like chemotaxis protein